MRTTTTEFRHLGALAARLPVLLLFFVYSSVMGFDTHTMRFERVTVADGLAQSAVYAIEQDKAGFLWFATESGIDRYDGFTFKHYRHERGNPNALASDFIRDLDLARNGALWIATDGGGVSRWNPTTDTITTYRYVAADPTSLSTDRIRTILAGDNDQVWIGTRDSGLDRLDVRTNQVSHYVSDPDDPATLSADEVYALALDGQGSLWIATTGGLSRLDTETDEITRVTLDIDGETQISARSLLIGRNGILWIGTTNNGLLRFDTESGAVTAYRHDADDPASLSSNRVDTIFQDDRRRLWVGTDKGLNLMDAEHGGFTVYRNEATDPASIGGNGIKSIYQDQGGLLWFGTLTAGVSKWNPRSWSFGHYKPATSGPNAFSSMSITAFTEDYDGNSWIGTFGGGINVIDRGGNVIQRFRYDAAASDSIGGDRVMAMITDRHGKIWAGTMRGGLSRIDPATGKAVTYRHDTNDPSSLAANGVMSLLQDNSGNIWVGTFGGGVSRFNAQSETFTNFTHDPDDETTLSSPRATVIAQGRDGVIWVGTDGGGLNYLNTRTGNWHQLKHDPDDPASLSANTIYSLHVDPRGRLWVGSREGLDRVSAWPLSSNGARVLDISAPEGMNRGNIFGIQSDMRGNLWLSSSQGLLSFNPDTGDIQSFHESQGLQGEEFNFGASYASPDGRLYFGGTNGFNMFDPASLQTNSVPPPVALTSLSIINEPVESDTPYELIRSLDLNYSDHVVTFGLSALDFTAPGQNRYAYMLEGFDETWVDAGNERRITYTNLDGGNYVLKVRASNSDGVWNESGIEIPLMVADPPWKTWWASTLYVLAFFGAVFMFWRHQENKLQRESEYSRRLEREVHERTRELNNRNKDLKIVNAKLMEASTTDALTGLRNRRFLFQQVNKDVDLVLRHYRDGTETMRPGGNNDLLFLMVDLDNFKPVNDNCGHEAGDRLLLQVRDVLLEACRTSDDVIRWGGDEFLIVARETNRNFAANLAERVRSSLSDRVFPVGDGQVARITSSIGYASYPFLKDRPDLLSWEEVLGVADAAMYEAKQNRNSWLGIEGIEWQGSGDELYRSIKSDPGQLAEDGVIRAVESVDAAAESLA